MTAKVIIVKEWEERERKNKMHSRMCEKKKNEIERPKQEEEGGKNMFYYIYAARISIGCASLMR